MLLVRNSSPIKDQETLSSGHLNPRSPLEGNSHYQRHSTNFNKLSQSEESQKVSMITKDIQPVQTPSMGPVSPAGFILTSQLDSLQQSLEVLITNDSSVVPAYYDNRNVRPT